MRLIAAIAVTLVVCVLATLLLIFGYIGGATWLVAFVVGGFAGLAIFYAGRWEEIEFRSLRLKLREVEQIRADVYAKAETVNGIAVELGAMTAYMASLAGRAGSREGHRESMRRARRSIENLVAVSGITPSVAATMLRPLDEMDVHDRRADLLEWVLKKAAELRSKGRPDLPKDDTISEFLRTHDAVTAREAVMAFLRQHDLFTDEVPPQLDAIDMAVRRFHG